MEMFSVAVCLMALNLLCDLVWFAFALAWSTVIHYWTGWVTSERFYDHDDGHEGHLEQTRSETVH